MCQTLSNKINIILNMSVKSFNHIVNPLSTSKQSSIFSDCCTLSIMWLTTLLPFLMLIAMIYFFIC